MKTIKLTLLANNVVQRSRLLVPLHCTGDAVSRLKTEFPDHFRFWGVGDGMTFEVKGDL